MTIYVDEPQTWDSRFKNYCHMWTDGDVAELHEMADKIGLKRGWFQVSVGVSGRFEHYDISPNKRALALKFGAQYMSLMKRIQKRLAEQTAK